MYHYSGAVLVFSLVLIFLLAALETIVDVIIAMLQTGLCRQERETTFLFIVFNMDSTTRYHLCVPLIALPGTENRQNTTRQI